MSYFIYIVSSLGLVTLQTALIPRLGFVGHSSICCFVGVYLAAFRPSTRPCRSWCSWAP